MPFINITTAKGLLDAEQKKELQKRITDVCVEIEGKGNPDFAQYVWIVVNEEDAESWCVAGTPMTPELVESLT